MQSGGATSYNVRGITNKLSNYNVKSLFNNSKH